jgi:hypothetical protein
MLFVSDKLTTTSLRMNEVNNISINELKEKKKEI